MKVRFSARAHRDLISIFDYLFDESPNAAFWVTDELEHAARELGERALQYAELPRHPGYRRHVVGSYGIFYVVRVDTVYIAAILHSARDHERILFPED